MIQGVLVFHSAGMHVVNKEFRADWELYDGALTSGFLSAVFTFFDESFGGVRRIETEKSTIIIEKVRDFFVVLLFQPAQVVEGTACTGRYFPLVYAAIQQDLRHKCVRSLCHFLDHAGEITTYTLPVIEFAPLVKEIVVHLGDAAMAFQESCTPQETCRPVHTPTLEH
jgi:hypothetical protein